MLHQPTLDKLQELKLVGMLKAYQEQQQTPDCQALSFEDRFGMLLDREATERANRRLITRLRFARLRQEACVEDIDFRAPRGLDRSSLLALADCRWIDHHDNCLIVGPTGAGKTYVACALAQKACREGYSVRYLRLPRLFSEFAIAQGDGRYPRLLGSLAKLDLVVLDDWGTAGLTPQQRHDLLEILEDRYQRRSTLVASQLPVSHWHEFIGDPTLADAIMDRLVHNAHPITLKGESMRKRNKPFSDDSKTTTMEKK
jgi:DNA replication protein DnaC